MQTLGGVPHRETPGAQSMWYLAINAAAVKDVCVRWKGRGESERWQDY